MALLKNLWKGNNNKRKKLPEEWDLASNQDFGVDEFSDATECSSYKVKYLGHLPVDGNAKVTASSASAIKAIVSMGKANSKVIQKVIVSVNLKGVEITDRANEKLILDVSVFRIRSCLVCDLHRRIFAFLATDSQEIMECHAFLCPKKSMAESLAVTVAQTFTAVYRMLQPAHRSSIDNMSYSKAPILQTSLPSYSKFEMEHTNFKENVPLTSISSTKWISFDDSLKDASSEPNRSFTYAEVYVSPPAYSERPLADSQLDHTKEWATPSTATAELIVL